jgi:Bacterial type II/III secretion system short domain
MKFKALLLAGLFCVGLTLTAFAQTNNEPKKTEQEDAQPSRGQMTAKIFEIKHRRPVDLSSAVLLLGSGAKGAQIVPNPELNTISVRDYPENVAAIEVALKRLDVPAAPQPTVVPVSLEFQLHLIAASMTAGEKAAFPKAIESVLPQLQSSLKFINYRYINTAIHRVVNDGRVEVSGVNSSLFPLPSGATGTGSNETPSFSQYTAEGIRLIADAAGKEFVQIRKFRFGASIPIRLSSSNVQYRDVGINTELTLREGELVVVGTANAGIGDEAIIVIVSVKKVK